jgi:F0F1-type ATP synthase epsilon subunit
MAGDVFGVEIVTPEQALWAGPATAVVLRTSVGWFTVLNGHTPLIGDVVSCEVRVEVEGEPPVRLAVHGGFVQVDTSPGASEGLAEPDGPLPGLSTRVTLLAGIAELVEDIDVERALVAKEVAESELASLQGAGRTSSAGPETGEGAVATLEDLEVVAARSALQRAELRLAVAGSGTSS